MQNKFSIALLILVLALAGVVYNILLRVSATEQQIGAIEKPVVNATNTQPVQAPRTAKNVKITITDEGFLPSGFQMGMSTIVTVSVTNQGKSAHSFVIDDPAIDTGSIEPGQTKTVTIDKQFDQAAALKYYSNIGDDNADSFKGTIMVF